MAVSVYPTGTTIYEPEKSWNGFTVSSTIIGDVRLIDMNGNVVNCWKGFRGFPNKILPGGYLLGSFGMRNSKFGFQDQMDLVQVDWDGKVVWKFNKYEYICDPGENPQWMARQHHDYQREGNPVGYYVPGMEPLVDRGNTLLLVHKNIRNPAISAKLLLDDAFIEVTWDGKIIWEWQCSDHFEEMGFSKSARKVLARNPNMLNIGEGFGDWMHINSLSKVGPNKWFEAGDQRFHPENLIWSSRESNILAITDKKTGEIVWKIGPDYNTGSLKKLEYIIGPHHVHMIPKGLPGEGNILVFDNGGWAGYGVPNPGSANGVKNARRDYSRVLEFDPLTLKIIWQYTPQEAGFLMPMYGHRFYSSLVSSAQRLPNGNTLITEGVDGRIFEITRKFEIVWEYVNPFHNKDYRSLVYRAYRVPYDWVPQAERTEEVAIHRLDNSKFNVTESKSAKTIRTTDIVREARIESGAQFCVLPKNDK